MNKRFILMLLIALLMASVAAWLASRWINEKTLPQKSLQVVVAALDIPFGVKVADYQLKIISWNGEAVPEGTYSSKEQVINRVTKNNFYAGELITEKRMSEYLAGSMLSALIKKDYRAISVRVDDVVGVSGFILPGNNVDVLATKIDRATNHASSQTLLQNITVLAVDQDVAQGKEKPSVVRAVTLELKPDQAKIMVSALQEGTIQLSLRNPLDTEIIYVPEKEVISLEKPEKKLHKTKHFLKVIPW